MPNFGIMGICLHCSSQSESIDALRLQHHLLHNNWCDLVRPLGQFKAPASVFKKCVPAFFDNQLLNTTESRPHDGVPKDSKSPPAINIRKPFLCMQTT